MTSFSVDIAAAYFDFKKAKQYPQDGFYIGLENKRAWTQLVEWMQLGVESSPVPQIENGKFLRLTEGQYVARTEIQKPRLRDKEDNSALTVIKTGRTTDDTVGILNGTTAPRSTVVQGEIKWVDANVQEFVVMQAMDYMGRLFSNRGDSGSPCADSYNRLVGWVTGGSGGRHTTHRTYIYPACDFFERQLREWTRQKALLCCDGWSMALPTGEATAS